MENDYLDKLKEAYIHPDLRIEAQLIKQDPYSWTRREILQFLERNDLKWNRYNKK